MTQRKKDATYIKPVFHLRILSREADFFVAKQFARTSLCFPQLRAEVTKQNGGIESQETLDAQKYFANIAAARTNLKIDIQSNYKNILDTPNISLNGKFEIDLGRDFFAAKKCGTSRNHSNSFFRRSERLANFIAT